MIWYRNNNIPVQLPVPSLKNVDLNSIPVVDEFFWSIYKKDCPAPQFWFVCCYFFLNYFVVLLFRNIHDLCEQSRFRKLQLLTCIHWTFERLFNYFHTACFKLTFFLPQKNKLVLNFLSSEVWPIICCGGVMLAWVHTPVTNFGSVSQN